MTSILVSRDSWNSHDAVMAALLPVLILYTRHIHYIINANNKAILLLEKHIKQFILSEKITSVICKFS